MSTVRVCEEIVSESVLMLIATNTLDSQSNCCAPIILLAAFAILVLISESVWPRGCVLDCTKGRHRSVCGSDGRLYKSLCTFQRAHCINTELRIAPRAHCADPAQSKCQQARAQALDSSSRSDAGGVFVPECTEEGTFLQVQCHSQTGYCWCSTPDGKPVSGTSVLHQRPNCTGSYPERPSSPERDSAQREEGSRLRPTPESNSAPSLPAEEITAPPFWVTILLNSDPRGNRSAKRPTDTHLSCERERIQVLDQARVLGRDDLFVPECRSDGRFSPVQCHRATGYCWCVRAETGRPLPGTSNRNRLPDCSAAESARSGLSDRDYRDRALPGCPGPKKRAFLHQLLQALLQEARQTSGSLLLPSPVSVSPAPSSPPAAAPAPAPGALEVSDAELALRRYFAQLDEDGSGALSEREARPLQQYVRRKVRPRRCGRKLAQYCDIDDDRALTLAELTACLALARAMKGGLETDESPVLVFPSRSSLSRPPPLLTEPVRPEVLVTQRSPGGTGLGPGGLCSVQLPGDAARVPPPQRESSRRLAVDADTHSRRSARSALESLQGARAAAALQSFERLASERAGAQRGGLAHSDTRLILTDLQQRLRRDRLVLSFSPRGITRGRHVSEVLFVGPRRPRVLKDIDIHLQCASDGFEAHGVCGGRRGPWDGRVCPPLSAPGTPPGLRAQEVTRPPSTRIPYVRLLRAQASSPTPPVFRARGLEDLQPAVECVRGRVGGNLIYPRQCRMCASAPRTRVWFALAGDSEQRAGVHQTGAVSADRRLRPCHVSPSPANEDSRCKLTAVSSPGLEQRSGAGRGRRVSGRAVFRRASSCSVHAGAETAQRPPLSAGLRFI
nr:PREDICTED: uncharacterized protein LOC102688086 [Lepisosteus oculatus]